MAAQRGVAATLLIDVGQFRMQDAVAQWFYPKLAQAGVKLVEFRKTQLHGKVAVIDDEWAPLARVILMGCRYSSIMKSTSLFVIRILRRHSENISSVA